MKTGNCVDCGKPIGEQRRGKPRKRCTNCSPPRLNQTKQPWYIKRYKRPGHRGPDKALATTLAKADPLANIAGDYRQCCCCPAIHNHTEPWCSPKCRTVLGERIARMQAATPVRKEMEGRAP